MADDDQTRIANLRSEVLSDDYYTLRKYHFEYRRRDGSVQSQSREAYDRGNGAAVLLYDEDRGTVVLTRQFRLPAFVNGKADGMLLEVPAGQLDQEHPEEAIKREIEEETGFRVERVERLFTAFSSPGSVTERLHYFKASYRPHDRIGDGGGEAHEGEDIETLEVTLDGALAMIADGRIQDAKTIILLYHAALAKRP